MNNAPVLLVGRPGEWIFEAFPRLFVAYRGAQVFASAIADALFTVPTANDNTEAP